MLPRKAIPFLLACIALGLAAIISPSSRSEHGHSLSLDTRFGRFGFKEYDWDRTHVSPASKGTTFEEFRERTREHFIARQFQPRTGYTTVVFLGPHTFRIDRSLSSVLIISCGGSCLVILLVAAIVKGCHVQSKSEINPA